MPEREGVFSAHSRNPNSDGLFSHNSYWPCRIASSDSVIGSPAVYGDAIDPATGVDLATVQFHSGRSGALQWRVLEAYNDVTRRIAPRRTSRALEPGRPSKGLCRNDDVFSLSSMRPSTYNWIASYIRRSFPLASLRLQRRRASLASTLLKFIFISNFWPEVAHVLDVDDFSLRC